MLNKTQVEQNKRRFDIGSGLSVELLDTNTLNFIFSDLVKVKLLGRLSGHRKDRQTPSITWREEYGIATKADTDELVILGASSVDKIEIHKILSNSDVQVALTTLSRRTDVDDDIGQLTFQKVITVIDDTLKSIGPLIKICTVNGYRSTEIDNFIEDHITIHGDKYSFPRKRLMANYTKNTKQGKIVLESYFIGQSRTNTSGSHPAMINNSTLFEFQKETTENFSLAQRYLNAWNNG